MISTTWIIITVVALALSALFSGVEIAFVSADRVRLELDIQKGGLAGRCLSLFYAHTSFFISTILVGNNIMLVIYGMGAAQLLEPWLADLLHHQGLVLLAQTLISTVVILLTGEFLPKTIFRINPNRSLRMAAPLTWLIYFILYPISAFATWISRALMRLMRVPQGEPRLGALTMGDLNDYLEQAIDEKAEEHQQVENEVKIFHNALDFSTIHLRDCMTPRNEIVAVDIEEATPQSLSDLFISTGRSKILVYRQDIDNILGYIHVSELFTPDKDWRTSLKPVLYAPETLLANKMMRRLLGEKRSIAVIIDEFGGTAGMVTLEDLVEEICGDIQDEHDKEQNIERQLPDGVFELSGRLEIEYLNEKYLLDLPEDDAYQTLAGYILHATGTIPDIGALVDLPPYKFEVLKKQASRLDLLRLSPL